VIGALLRKARQVGQDPVLRRWLFERLLDKTPGPPAFKAHCPPYLASLELGPSPQPDQRFATFALSKPAKALVLDLAGLAVTVHPHEAAHLFKRQFDDIEQLLALHRFAWADEDCDPDWVALLWQEWLKRFACPDTSWAWHPYTAAERAINLLTFAHRHGLPEPFDASWRGLATHAPAIASRLEYFGPHYTGNHLANNGRGLFRIGTALGWSQATELGGKILLEEAKRIFGPSGMLIEGSSHYHLLLARNYGQAAAWAEQVQWPQAAALQTIAERARFAAGGLFLSGGLPLIGDISPDLPPAKLCPQFERTEADLSADGWHRFEEGDWSLLLYAPPDGWVPMPGHGHQDLGSFELHWRGVPLIVDPGRGRYGDTGEAAEYLSAIVHNNLKFIGRDWKTREPRPTNRPYYAPEFRRRIGGTPPSFFRSMQRFELSYPMNGATISRRFVALGNRFIIEDSVAGRGKKVIERSVVIPQPVEIKNTQATFATPMGKIRLTEETALLSESITRWARYGQGQPATILGTHVKARLPWHGRVTLEAV
jgi:hypothetical protein